MPNINITPLYNSSNDSDEVDSSFLELNHREAESSYETSRKCLQLADTVLLNNKRLVDENQRLQRVIYLMQKKMQQMNNSLKDLIHQTEINKLFLIPYLKNFFILTEEDKKEKCPICLDKLMNISNEDIVKTSCCHIFHGSCYYQNRSNTDEQDICGLCRQRHVPFDIGYIDNKKEWRQYTEVQIKDNLTKVLEIYPTIELPSIDEIMCQIYQKTKTSIKYY